MRLGNPLAEDEAAVMAKLIPLSFRSSAVFPACNCDGTEQECKQVFCPGEDKQGHDTHLNLNDLLAFGASVRPRHLLQARLPAANRSILAGANRAGFAGETGESCCSGGQ